MTRFPKLHPALFALVLLALGTGVHADPIRPPQLKNVAQVLGIIQGGTTGRLMEHGLKATAEVLVDVDEKGRVTAYKLVRPTGNRIVDSELAQAARKLTFEPAQQDGRNVPSRAVIPFVFGEKGAQVSGVKVAGKD